MSGVAKIIIIGILGNNPEVRQMPSGDTVCNISIATSKTWKDKNSGEQKEKTEWHRVVMFRKLGEIAGQYLKKGSKVYIEGKLQTRKWQDKDGHDKYTREIVADNMQMLDSRNTSNAAPQSAPIQQPPAGADPFEDNIPF